MRQRISPGTVGPVAVVPVGTTDGSREQVIPAPLADDDSRLPYPPGWKVGRNVKVPTPDGVALFSVTRWRGLARVVDDAGGAEARSPHPRGLRLHAPGRMSLLSASI